MGLYKGAQLIAGSLPIPPGAMAYKGSCLQADLPTSGQLKGDYYKLTDASGQYAGQCAIWNSSSWDYSSSNINVDSTLSKTSTNPVENKIITEAINAMAQTIYDGIYPINGDPILGFNHPGIPSGVTATWQEDKTYTGRYLKIDGNQTVGTKEAESLPKPTISLANNGKHSHSFTPSGTLDEQGGHKHGAVNWADYPLTTSGVENTFGMVFESTWKKGYTPAWGTDTQGAHKHTFSGAAGVTGEKGEHTHTVTITGDAYVAGGAVKPLTVTIKAWKRIA